MPACHTLPPRLLPRPPLRPPTTRLFTTPPSPTPGSPAAALAAARTLLTTPPPATYLSTPLTSAPLQKLSLTLIRPSLYPSLGIAFSPPPRGTPLPPGYHLLYFTPAALESEMGADGTVNPFELGGGFSRRMWAGGRVEWDRRGLEVGEEAEEVTRVVGAEGKRGGDGRGMVVVGVEKVVRGEEGGGVREVRSWVFRPPVEGQEGGAGKGREVKRRAGGKGTVHAPSRVWDVPSADPRGFVERHMRWSPVALFSFSALTFNAHKIHYSESWAREVEGHPGLVVHGPMNLINMLDYWRDVHGQGDDRLRLKAIDYRATAPIYAGEEYRIVTTAAVLEGTETKYALRVMKGDVVCMRGDITAERDNSG